MTMNKAPEFFSVIVPVYNRPDEVRELLYNKYGKQ